MNVHLLKRAARALDAAPPSVEKAFIKQIQMLKTNPRHPSLQVKRYRASERIYQARVNRSWRFYFTINGDTIVITNVIPHPK